MQRDGQALLVNVTHLILNHYYSTHSDAIRTRLAILGKHLDAQMKTELAAEVSSRVTDCTVADVRALLE